MLRLSHVTVLWGIEISAPHDSPSAIGPENTPHFHPWRPPWRGELAMLDPTLIASFGSALWTTAVIGLAAAASSFAWGTVLFAATLIPGRAAALLVDVYVQIFRNIPVLLPIYLVYFGLPLIGLLWPTPVCGVVALTLQQGAYVSEILRGSAKAIDRAQHDAALSIGLSPWSAFRRVFLPQIIVYSLPALGNQTVLIVKDTSLLSAITVVELMMQARLVVETTGTIYMPFILATALYLVLVLLIDIAFALISRRAAWR